MKDKVVLVYDWDGKLTDFGIPISEKEYKKYHTPKAKIEPHENFYYKTLSSSWKKFTIYSSPYRCISKVEARTHVLSREDALEVLLKDYEGLQKNRKKYLRAISHGV